MPRAIVFRREGAHLHFTGVVTGPDLFGINDIVLGHDYPGMPRYALCDFSDAERVDVSVDDLRRIAEEDHRDAERIAGVAVVIVAPQTLTYGLARMWEGMTDSDSLLSVVVRTRREAVAWLAGRGIAVPVDPDGRLTGGG